MSVVVKELFMTPFEKWSLIVGGALLLIYILFKLFVGPFDMSELIWIPK